MSNNTDDFLFGSGSPSAFGKDDPVGKTVTGQIISTDVRQQTDIRDGSPLTWDNGDAKMQLVVMLQTSERSTEIEDDDGQRAIYVKGSKKAGSQSLHDAVATAVRRSGAKGLEPGGTLAMTFTGTEPSQTRGFNDRKLWSASYTPPDQSAQTGDYLGTGQQQQVDTSTGEIQQPAQNTPEPAPQQQTAQQQGTPEQIAALRAAGVDPATVFPNAS